MPSIQTRIHGHAVVAERWPQPIQERVQPGEVVPGSRTFAEYPDIISKHWGWGTEFQAFNGARECWFHIPIPTPQWMNGSQLYLDQFFVFFMSDPTVSIRDVHLYDGSAKVWVLSLVTPLSGDWKGPQQPADANPTNTWHTIYQSGDLAGQRVLLNTAMGLSLRGLFESPGSITFYSAGAAWVDSPT